MSYSGLQDMENCDKWSYLHLDLMWELQIYTKVFDDVQEKLQYSNLSHDNT